MTVALSRAPRLNVITHIELQRHQDPEAVTATPGGMQLNPSVVLSVSQ